MADERALLKQGPSKDRQQRMLKDRPALLYPDFLSLWKDADPNISILRQAKAERARL